MGEYEKQYPIQEMDPMYDMYYYDQDAQNGYGYDEDQLDDEDGFDSDENLQGLYVEGLADRIWDEND